MNPRYIKGVINKPPLPLLVTMQEYESLTPLKAARKESLKAKINTTQAKEARQMKNLHTREYTDFFENKRYIGYIKKDTIPV